MGKKVQMIWNDMILRTIWDENRSYRQSFVGKVLKYPEKQPNAHLLRIMHLENDADVS